MFPLQTLFLKKIMSYKKKLQNVSMYFGQLLPTTTLTSESTKQRQTL